MPHEPRAATDTRAPHRRSIPVTNPPTPPTHATARGRQTETKNDSRPLFPRPLFPRAPFSPAGYDSAFNHGLARERMGIRSWIKAKVGRPTDKPPTDRHRRHMQRQLKGSQRGKPYGQRAQVETVMSMLKRNLGGHLRARNPVNQRMEMLLKVVVHNLMVV